MLASGRKHMGYLEVKSRYNLLATSEPLAGGWLVGGLSPISP